ncbi:MAG TPA: hypothetical protein DCY59_12330 [Micrococcaceae bacterium]|nr:hypothetical protein [Micrococcaceae bacterium]
MRMRTPRASGRSLEIPIAMLAPFAANGDQISSDKAGRIQLYWRWAWKRLHSPLRGVRPGPEQTALVSVLQNRRDKQLRQLHF